ncbi:ribbon-helix-helix protein, CopG family [Avibacterium paragallinarum]|uniref:Ribbon-helix-helix protein, CopG family n=1 Tax=Avibacterium paragallinarum TaxID=728 RepID=A0AAE5TM04_AVIPA|nr:ribbon-helix-helix protein, CopG family [Avibacterium paragallinarum]MEE3608173.1 ribbon-helix-helix protein, CopG family [Avibacterium paragallinarum]MEE3621273.1 ribbon-helix-helix protein, CopG family [Avibacterium paragallinarum]MEE3669302.1 ribbon-helix-helix protein, CopG family [Avibacterium paragallinarum]MEE3681428.1 ribbon-helix-helix protein, CopG family [Avibacterium paragallinarum]MEE4386738.1 ribbon-helix-helix protein, CopG family [Avibacterium paragallinarum]
MALSRTEINARSEAKRGIVTKAFKIHHSVSENIDKLAAELGLSKGKVLEYAINQLCKMHLKK